MIPVRFARFTGVGVVGFFVDAAVLYAVSFLGAGWYSGRVISFLAAVVTTWLINRRWTFETGSTPPSLSEFTRYLVAMTLGGAANYMTYVLIGLAVPYTGWMPLVGVAAGSAVGLLVNFTTASRAVFREP